MDIVDAAHVPCRDPRDRWVCASVAYALARRHLLDPRACAEIALAAAELGSNAVRHGGGGELVVRAVIAGSRRGIELVCRDQGDGIGDVESAMRDGWSDGRPRGPDDAWNDGLGVGLGTVRRSMNELEIASARGLGTTVAARRWSR